MIKRILVPLDDTEYSVSATWHAIDIAKRFHAQVTGIAIIDVPGITQSTHAMGIGTSYYAKLSREHSIETSQERNKQILARFCDSCSKAGVTFLNKSAEAAPFDAIIEEAKYFDLIVMGIRSKLSFYAEEGDEMKPLYDTAKSGMRPFLAVTKKMQPIKEIMLCYNGSTPSAATLHIFALYNLWPDAHITLFKSGFHEEDDREVLSKATTYLEAHEIHVHPVYQYGSPKELIPELAEKNNADLLVMGTQGKSRLKEFFLGSTTKKLITDGRFSLFLHL